MYPAVVYGFLLELFRSWPEAAAKSLSLTYGKPEVSFNSLVDMYLGKPSAGPIKSSVISAVWW